MIAQMDDYPLEDMLHFSDCDGNVPCSRDVRSYHLIQGDDYGSEESRQETYRAVWEGIRWFGVSPDELNVLDVGSGEGHLEGYLRMRLGGMRYTGIDLKTGTNVLDYYHQHNVVVGLGVLYKASNPWELLEHMWSLAGNALIVDSLSTWAETKNEDELYLEPGDTLKRTARLTKKVILRHDFHPHRFMLYLYR